MKQRTLIYLPAFNEAQNIESTIKKLPKSIDGCDEVQYLVVDDGSTDQTANIAKSLGVNVISFSTNRGLGEVFREAINYVLEEKFDVLVSMDADGQFLASEIELVAGPVIRGEADFSTGCRFDNGKRPPFMSLGKYQGNKLMNILITEITGSRIRDASCGFRAYSRETLFCLTTMGRFTYTHETMINLISKGFKLAQVPITVEYFEGRKSRVASSLIRYATRSALIILRAYRDYMPLRFFFGIGLFFLAVSLILGGFTISHWIVRGSLFPYKSYGIIALASLGASIVMCLVGLLADMFTRIRVIQEQTLILLRKELLGDRKPAAPDHE